MRSDAQNSLLVLSNRHNFIHFMRNGQGHVICPCDLELCPIVPSYDGNYCLWWCTQNVGRNQANVLKLFYVVYRAVGVALLDDVVHVITDMSPFITTFSADIVSPLQIISTFREWNIQRTLLHAAVIVSCTSPNINAFGECH